MKYQVSTAHQVAVAVETTVVAPPMAVGDNHHRTDHPQVVAVQAIPVPEVAPPVVASDTITPPIDPIIADTMELMAMGPVDAALTMLVTTDTQEVALESAMGHPVPHQLDHQAMEEVQVTEVAPPTLPTTTVMDLVSLEVMHEVALVVIQTMANLMTSIK